MATFKVTGYTKEELAERRESWSEDSRNADKVFEETFCLAKIPKQPPDYQGPDRFCMMDEVKPFGSNHLCKYHGSAGEIKTDHLDKLAAMKHGMRAARENLVKDFDDKDEALYDWIMETYPEAYDIDFDEDPNAELDLHKLAAEVVRGERGRGYLLKEGEVHEKEVRNEEGRIVIGDDGEVVTEKSEHYLAGMIDRHDKKLLKMEKELGITRKEQMKQDSTDSAVEAIKGFAELGGAFLARDDKEYDPDDKPWEEDEE